MLKEADQVVKPIRVGTRRSALAVAQTKRIIGRLAAAYPELSFELAGIQTQGDIQMDARLDLAGGKGLFVGEIEKALLDDSIDMAVHSMKDMPPHMPEGLIIAAVSPREDPRDVLITRDGAALDGLKSGAVVGTSSRRRGLQLLHMRPDLNIEPLRGNVLTRLDRLKEDLYDAIVLAAAGMIRLGLTDRCTQYFSTTEMIPAIGQGILGVQIKRGSWLQDMLRPVHCEDAWLQLKAERAFMMRLDGGCSAPIAAHGVITGGRMKLEGMQASPQTGRIWRAALEGDKAEAAILGEQLAQRIYTMAAGKAWEDTI